MKRLLLWIILVICFSVVVTAQNQATMQIDLQNYWGMADSSDWNGSQSLQEFGSITYNATGGQTGDGSLVCSGSNSDFANTTFGFTFNTGSLGFSKTVCVSFIRHSVVASFDYAFGMSDGSPSGAYSFGLNNEHPITWIQSSDVGISTFVTNTSTAVYNNSYYTWCWQYDKETELVTSFLNGTTMANTSDASAGSGFIANTPLVCNRQEGSSITRAFDGEIDWIAIWNRSLNTSEIDYVTEQGCLVNGFMNCPNNFTIIANDSFTGAQIENFTVYIGGDDNYSTTTGTVTTGILATNTTLFNITVESTQGNGYFNTTYYDVDVGSELEANLTQAIINISVYSEINNGSVSTFSVLTPYGTFSTTSGTVSINVTNASHSFEVSATGYLTENESFTINALAEDNLSVYLGANITFNIFKETDGSIFPVNDTDETKLTIYCQNTTQEIIFTNYSNTTIVDCAWDYMKLDMVYPDESYYRTLIPEYGDTNISFYMLDLNNDLALQIIMTLNDLTGECSDGSLLVKKFVDEVEVNVIQQLWSAAQEATLYMLKDGAYTLSVVCTDQTRNLGTFFADAAGTKTITVPQINFLPETTLGNEINWAWDWNGSNIVLTYNDSSDNPTTTLTFTVYNGSDTTQELYSTTEADVTQSSYTYLGAINESYLACITGVTATGIEIDDCDDFWNGTTLPAWEGFNETYSDGQTLEEKAKNWISIIVVSASIIGLGAHGMGAAGLALGAILTFFFQRVGWMNLGSDATNYTVLVLLALMAGLLAYVKGRDKR